MLKTGRYSVAKPKEVLHKFNRSFIENKIGEGTYFVTVVYCIFELHKRKLTVSIAGHHALPVIKRNDGRLETIELQGFPIGWFEVDEEYKERRYQLDPGDTLFLYTDGLLDIARGKGRIDFDSVNALIQRDDMEKVLDRMIRSYRKRDEGERDDVTLLAMHVTS
jgi:sigma-B regulation protein RsbU (phosphoserine phosphatase)